MTGSQIAQPSDESCTNGMIGWPRKWCTTSQAVCSNQPIPMNVHESSPRYAT
jgi:hypothetical protein